MTGDFTVSTGAINTKIPAKQTHLNEQSGKLQNISQLLWIINSLLNQLKSFIVEVCINNLFNGATDVTSAEMT